MSYKNKTKEELIELLIDAEEHIFELQNDLDFYKDCDDMLEYDMEITDLEDTIREREERIKELEIDNADMQERLQELEANEVDYQTISEIAENLEDLADDLRGLEK